jgi:uncharacterized protein (DUF362 family)
MKPRVAWGVTTPQYNHEPPFHPDQRFPELPFDNASTQPNAPYTLLRELFHRLGLDPANPLGQIIRPGQTVVIKPNFVLSFHAGADDLFAVVTHPSILRALVDYTFLALKGTGRIIIADAPQMDCDWDELMAAQRLDAIQDFYRKKFNFNLELYDLRNFALIDRHQLAYSSNRKPRPGDPLGTAIVNLGRRSAFYGRPNDNYYGADFDRSVTMRHHHDKTHEYAVSKTILSADVFLSVPKMKVHKKVGVTLNLKGLVGINTDKNYLVHHTVGTPTTGGDQLPDGVPASDRFVTRAQRWLADRTLARQSGVGDAIYRAAAAGYRALIKPWQPRAESTLVLDSGNWHGNDSAWRMTSDLAKIIFFSDANGQLHDTRQRKIFCVVDGIIGGENNGPLSPDAKPAGCLVAGENPVAVDIVTARLMGFDPGKIRQFDILQSPEWDFGFRSADEIELVGDSGLNFHFQPHPGWVGHIER